MQGQKRLGQPVMLDLVLEELDKMVRDGLRSRVRRCVGRGLVGVVRFDDSDDLLEEWGRGGEMGADADAEAELERELERSTMVEDAGEVLAAPAAALAAVAAAVSSWRG